jgi:hypothetical protein
MDLKPAVERLRGELLAVAAVGDEQAAAVAQRVAGVLDSALSLRLIELVGDVAAEVSGQLPNGRVEVRLAGQDPELVYVEEAPPPAGDEVGLTARITLRLPEGLKVRIEDAAGREGLSVNSWLVRALGRAVASERRVGVGRRMSGYGRS